MEIRETDVSPSNIPSRAGDTEIQYPGLSAPDGAIPKGDQKGQTGPAHAETARVRFQPGGREPESRLTGLRYDEGEGKVRRDGKLEARDGAWQVTEEMSMNVEMGSHGVLSLI